MNSQTQLKSIIGLILGLIIFISTSCNNETDNNEEDVHQYSFIGNWAMSKLEEYDDVLITISGTDTQFTVHIIEDRMMCFCHECSTIPVGGLQLNNFTVNPTDPILASLENINLSLTSQVTLTSVNMTLMKEQLFLGLYLRNSECPDFGYVAGYSLVKI